MQTSIPLWVAKLWCPKNFFQLHFDKRYAEVTINDFTMHLIISKWLWTQKSRQKRKTMRQRVWSKKSCQWKCFHSLTMVRWVFAFSFTQIVYTLLRVIPFALLAASFKLRLLRSSNKLIAIQIFYLNIWIYEFLKNHPQKRDFTKKSKNRQRQGMHF